MKGLFISMSSIETVLSATPAGGEKVHPSPCKAPFLSPQATSINAAKRDMTKLFLTYKTYLFVKI
jgi:hypothetical protein